MTEWTLLKRLLDAVHQHSTMIGRLWLTVMVIFRLLVVAVATDDVYTDEQEMFVCNTLQPGCPTVCYDAFAPISQPRFWVFHIISVSTPSLCFIVYTWHNLSKRPCPQRWPLPHRRDPAPWSRWDSREVHDVRCDSDSCSVRSHQHLGHRMADKLEGVAAHDLQGGDQNNVASSGPARACALREGPAEAPGVSGGVLSTCYVLHVCLRAVLEAGFVLAQWRLFGFRVPIRFRCSAAPCSQAVDCYVSRPTEKTVFLLFMFCVGVFCILLNLLELNHLGWKKIRQALRMRAGPSWGGPTKGGYETFRPDSPSLTSTLGIRDGTSTTSLPTLDLVVGHQPDWTVVNCGRMREPEGVTETRLECHRGERQPLKTQKDSRGSQQKSAEVWI